MAFTVFISYSAPDRDLVNRIKEAAAPIGLRVYSYDQDLQPGENLPQKLLREIHASDVVLVLLTHTSASSPSVNQEIGVARAAEKMVIPVLETGVDANRFTFLQGIEYETLDRANPEQTLIRLTGRLARLKAKNDTANVIGLALIAGFALWLLNKSP